MRENENQQGQETRPAGKKQNKNIGASSGGNRKRRPQYAAKKNLKNNAQKAATPEGQKRTEQTPKRKKQGSVPVSEKNRNTSAAAQGRRNGVKGTQPGGRQKKSNRQVARKGPPKIHDDYDDIRSYGGRYLQLPDYDELETATLSSAGLLST